MQIIVNAIKSKAIFTSLVAITGLTTGCVIDRNSSEALGHVNRPRTISRINDETYEGRSKTVVFAVGDPDTSMDRTPPLAKFHFQPILPSMALQALRIW